jgi:hypothetical protein
MNTPDTRAESGGVPGADKSRRRPVLKLKKGEHVITAFAQSASGPGWANSPVVVIVRGLDGAIRQEWIQPREQTREMVTLYPLSQAIHQAMTAAVQYS